MIKSAKNNDYATKKDENKKKKLLMIAYLPSPYWVDFLNIVGQSFDLTVLFEQKDSKDRKDTWLNRNFENFKATYLPRNILKRFWTLTKYSHQNYDIFWNCDYSKWECIYMNFLFKIKNRIILLHADGGVVIPRKIDFLISFVMKQATFYASSGVECDKYFKYYKVDENKIFHYRFTSLTKDQINNNLKFKAENKYELKQKMNLKDELIIVSVGRQIYGKGYDVLLKSLVDIQKPMKVFIVGGKPTNLNDSLKRELKLEYVNFIDFLPFEQIKQYYAIADVFIMPTRSDVWGLVINEAMSFGLPIISSDKCAGGVEIINKFQNGIIVETDSIESLQRAIVRIMENSNLLEIFSKKSVEAIKDYSLENMANDYINILMKL
ncbi:MAG: glycosyltransferase family 4 protein [Erysipelotrichales bacterium]|nr:glycosyltransferase family 4 protein [Erysipelotrichales bacterium]